MPPRERTDSIQTRMKMTLVVSLMKSIGEIGTRDRSQVVVQHLVRVVIVGRAREYKGRTGLRWP